MLLRGREHRPLTVGGLAAAPPDMRAAAQGLLRLARVSEDVAETLRSHPDAPVRRAAACLAARAYPVLAAFGEAPGAPSSPGTRTP